MKITYQNTTNQLKTTQTRGILFSHFVCKVIAFLSVFFQLPALAEDLVQEVHDLPLWMETTRIQPVVNTFYPVNRLPVSSGKMYRGNKNTDQIFSQGFNTLNGLGINAVTELAKDNWRPPSWPSAVPSNQGKHPETPNIKTSLLNSSADVVLKLSENAQSNAMRLGVYYWNTGEGRPKNVDTRSPSSKYLYKADTYQWSPPDSWFCKNLDGSLAAVTLPNGTIRGYYFDFTSEPYRKFTLQRFRELAHRGVDNIFFDERHQPNHEDDGCFGGATERAYIKKYGRSELPLKKHFNDRKYRQYITFQGEKLAESFKYWKGQLEKEFGDERPLFTINGLYTSGFTFPHMSLDLLEVADSVKVEFRNGIRDFISEGFKAPDIDPVFRSPVNIPRPPNDIRTALALVIGRDGADGRPFTSWAVEHDFSTEEKALVFHAAVLAYGGIAAPNINFKNMQGVVLNQTSKQQFNKNLKSAINLSKKIEPSLAFARPYKFAALHLSEAQRTPMLTSASIWRKIMWPIHSAFEFFVREGLPATIITDKQIREGKLKDYQVAYFTVSSFEKLPVALKTNVKEFQSNGGLAIWKDQQYKVGQPAIKLLAFSKLIKSRALISVDYGKDIPANIHPHAVFFSKNQGNTNIIALLNDFTHILHRQAKSKNKIKPKKIKSAQLILAYKPISVTEVFSNTALKVERLSSGKYLVRIPEFQTVTLLSIQKTINKPHPKLAINPKYANIQNRVSAEMHLDETSCLQHYSLNWGDGFIEKVSSGNNCPSTLRLSHRYKKQGVFPITLSFENNNKTLSVSKSVNINNISCSLQTDKKIAKKGEPVKLTWKSHGAHTAILSHGSGLVPLVGQRKVRAPQKAHKIQYQLTIYNKDMRHTSSCSTTVKYTNK